MELFEQMAPGVLDNPMLAMAQQMTLSEVLSVASEARPLYEAVVNALNAAERQG